MRRRYWRNLLPWQRRLWLRDFLDKYCDLRRDDTAGYIHSRSRHDTKNHGYDGVHYYSVYDDSIHQHDCSSTILHHYLHILLLHLLLPLLRRIHDTRYIDHYYHYNDLSLRLQFCGSGLFAVRIGDFGESCGDV